MTEQKQILNMLEEGKITVDEASELLSAVGSKSTKVNEKEKKRASSRFKKIRIIVDSDKANGKKSNLNLDLPLGLAKFASKFIGKEKMIDIKGEGIDIDEIIKAIKEDDLEEGILFEKETVKNKKGATARIKIEVI